MRIGAALVSLAAAACASRSAPVVMTDEQLGPARGPIVRPPGEMTCAGNADALMAAFHRDGSLWGEELRDFLRDRCLSDGWSAAARDCASEEAYPACLARTLTGWQRDRLIGVVAADRVFDVAATPHYQELVCRADCAPPPPATPCDRAARRIVADLAAEYGAPVVPAVAWTSLAAVVLDQCRITAWPAAAADCVADRGVVVACTDQLTEQQQDDPELAIAIWLVRIKKLRFDSTNR